jgi:hypothetical protein
VEICEAIPRVPLFFNLLRMIVLRIQDDNNNNNNNIYLLQMGCHPVAVITLHIFPNTANKFT